MNLSKKIILGFSMVITLSALDYYINYLLTEKVNVNSEFLINSESIIRNSSNLHKDMIQMQSAFRGFLLTEDLAFISIYNFHLRDLSNLFSVQRSLIRESSQKSKLDSIEKLHHIWMAYAGALITAKKESLQSAKQNKEYRALFENRLRKKVGKKINDQIAKKFEEFDVFEYKVRAKRRMALSLSIKETHQVSLLFILITIVLSIICTLYISKSIANRIKYMVSLASNIAQGNFEPVIDNKKDELSDLSASLNKMSQNLRKNIRELERRNTELSQFASVVSHDLKAPLRGIHNVVSWIEEDMTEGLSDTLKKYLKIISERIGRMESLINGLLAYSLISRDRPVKELVDLKKLVQDIFDSIVPDAFEVDTYGLPVIYTSKIRLEQVLSNLISNAVKYAKEESGNIMVTCRELTEWYEFSVIDNGIGIDPMYHEKIFVIFQTLREKDSAESTGIGLSIVKKIIEEQQESISVDSTLGKGSIFTFTWHK
jgi:signal transduction histidine kinase